MTRGSETASRAYDALRTLYERGPLGNRADADLIALYLGPDHSASENAFAVLVRRHGPAVLGVCRRLLSGSPDAEDAFQAAFLVLARRAGAIRRPENLASWLHGVALRTAREARRRAARIRRREGGTMIDPRAAEPPTIDDRLPQLVEEIDRLPDRLRAPLVLCELEGLSRKEAAERLRLSEGTLSSRLARGRAKLRDRLQRRGESSIVGVGGLAGGAVETIVPEALAEATIRSSLAFASRNLAAGAVPAAVASLAEGVLRMMVVSKLKIAAIATIAAAGIAFAAAPRPSGPPLPIAPLATDEPGMERMQEGKPIARGVVVDRDGKPVAGAVVMARAYSTREARGVSGPDGSFAIPIDDPRLDGLSLLARSDDRVGFYRYEYDLTKEQAATPARITIGPGRTLAVIVVNPDKAPIPGAAVQAQGRFQILDEAMTDDGGMATLILPPAATVQWVLALKSGRGFDYAEFGSLNENGRSLDGKPASGLPERLALTLDGVRKAQIRAVDSKGTPVAGVGFHPWLLQKEGRRGHVNLPDGRAFVAKTDATGLATFDWLPLVKDSLIFWPQPGPYAHRRVEVEAGAAQPVLTTLWRNGTIRGIVRNADGSPAAGIRLLARGGGPKLREMGASDEGSGQAITTTDGSYAMEVPPDETYAVWVDDPDRAATTRFGVPVGEGLAVSGVDFALRPGTVIRGRVTIGPEDRPAAGQYVAVTESPRTADAADVELNIAPSRYASARTDAEGRYNLRVGPGRYGLRNPSRSGDAEEVTVGNEAEIVLDFHMERPNQGPISGRVIRADDPDRGVAGAKIHGVVADPSQNPDLVAEADAEGRFRARRWLDKMVVCASSPDDSLGGIVEITGDDAEVVIPVAPTAQAKGLILDERGHPLAKTALRSGRRVYLGGKDNPWRTAFSPKVVTDAEGRFLLPRLIVGQKYDITVPRDNGFVPVAAIAPEEAVSIDLGTLRIGDFHEGKASSSFREDAPDAGAPAPPLEATTLGGDPLTLADLRGKFVLIDFWATWCGPCLAEVPQLQAVYDAFGKDERFVLLSVSVDEKIAEPIRFQDKRQLPWKQAFLAGGLHGPKPGAFGVIAIPAFVLVGPDGKIVARGMRGEGIKEAIAKALRDHP